MPRTKWLFLNTPNNPSGTVHTAAETRAFGEVLVQRPNILVLSNEIYEHIIFGRHAFISFGEACPEPRECTLIANDVAKSYAMTGWRIGYAAGPALLVKAMSTVPSQSCTPVTAPMQAAALAALTGPQDCVATFRAAFERRRDLVVAGIAGIEDLTLSPPEGAFYAYIGCRGLVGRGTPAGNILADDIAVVDYFLAEGHASSVPGSAYGLSPFFRISTAATGTTLTEAIARIGSATASLQPAGRTAFAWGSTGSSQVI